MTPLILCLALTCDSGYSESLRPHQLRPRDGVPVGGLVNKIKFTNYETFLRADVERHTPRGERALPKEAGPNRVKPRNAAGNVPNPPQPAAGQRLKYGNATGYGYPNLQKLGQAALRTWGRVYKLLSEPAAPQPPGQPAAKTAR